MKRYPLYKLLKKKESVGLLCNQSGWHTVTGKYSFQSLAEQGRLKKVFIPEHGLFGELQDQVKLDDISLYKKIGSGIKWISLYNSSDPSLTANEEELAQLDTLIIDIQDVGCRYYTYISTIWLLLKKITALHLPITIIVLDKPNPAGRQVEGIRMTKDYASFIGLEGLPHRHGLTTGELCRYFKAQLNGSWELIVYPFNKKEAVFISPSPNIPTVNTCALYSGQCLWEGTNISEGRGTTLPFEMIGSPLLDWVFTEDWNSRKHPVFNKNCYTRPLIFKPVFHKYTHETCHGLHWLVHNKSGYHSLAHSLRVMKYVKGRSPGFEWRRGSYEAFNDKTAIELLAGDRLLLNYLDNKADWKEVKTKLNDEERKWIKDATPFLLCKTPLQKLKLI
ncbi:MAG: DUF1343 domain-containing protein [Chitinophagaceae bacterium]|nr:DUF1343 domain-containing protein [Chitinophagaceae bacterium]